MATMGRLGLVMEVVIGLSAVAAAASPTFLLATDNKIVHMSQDGTLLGYRNETIQWWQSYFLAANPANGTACWVTAPEDQSKIGNVRCALIEDLDTSWDLPRPENFRVNKADALELDPATGNWFITESRDNYVCNHNFSTCARTGQTGGNVRFYAAYDLPNGLLFMITTETVNPYRLEVVNLNGTGRHQINEDNFVDDPSALAVDSTQRMVYWLDKHKFKTGLFRCDYQGENTELLVSFDDMFDSYRRDIAIVGDNVYVMWADQRKITRINKNTKEMSQVVDGKSTDGSTEVALSGIKTLVVVSDSPANEGGCASENGGCPHLCVPANVNDGTANSCICQPGQELVDTACFDVEPATVLVLRKDSLDAVDVDSEETTTILSGLQDATRINFFYMSPREYLLFWVDNGGLYRGHWKVGGLVDNVEALVPENNKIRVFQVAVDWGSGNVVWLEEDMEVDRFSTEKMRIKIARVDGSSIRTLANDRWRNPSAFIIHSDGLYMTVGMEGYFPFKSWELNGKSSTFGLHDELERLQLGYRLEDIAVDTSAVSDSYDITYFWVNSGNGSINAASREFSYSLGKQFVVLTDASLKNASGLDLYADHLFWADRVTGALMAGHRGADGNVHQFGTHTGGTEPRAVRVLHPRRQPAPSKRFCDSQKSGCSDICVYVIHDWTRKSLCLCPDGETLEEDEKTCH